MHYASTATCLMSAGERAAFQRPEESAASLLPLANQCCPLPINVAPCPSMLPLAHYIRCKLLAWHMCQLVNVLQGEVAKQMPHLCFQTY